MERKFSVSFIALLSVMMFVSNTASSQDYKTYKNTITSPKAIINNAIWEKTSKDMVYNSCLTALHLQGYELEPLMTSKESGLIVTKAANFYPPIWQHKWIGGEYFLNVLVYELEAGIISINIQIKGTKLFDYEPDKGGGFKRIDVQNGENKNIGRFKQSEIQNGLSIKVSEDIEQFLVKLEAILGKSVSKTTTLLTWK